MARPKAELPPQAAVQALVDKQGRLAVRVTPGAKRDAIALADGKLLVHVRAQPEGGRANQAVLRLVAKALGLAPRQVTLFLGGASREKVLQLDS